MEEQKGTRAQRERHARELTGAHKGARQRRDSSTEAHETTRTQTKIHANPASDWDAYKATSTPTKDSLLASF